MNIILLGCSWGVPNYFGPPGDHFTTHTEYLLKDLGHTVFNCSMNAGSNFQSWMRAKNSLNGVPINHPASGDWPVIPAIGKTKIDLAIWFHTDMGRDRHIIDSKNKSIAKQIEEISEKVYIKYASLFKELNCKVVIVGGCADVDPIIERYIRADYLIPSWQKLLLNVSSKFHRLESGLRFPTEEDIKLIDETLAAYTAMDQSPLFPDGSHPGGIAHKMLLDLLREQNLGL